MEIAFSTYTCTFVHEQDRPESGMRYNPFPARRLHAYREKIVKSHRAHAHSYGTAGVDRERDRAHDLLYRDESAWMIAGVLMYLARPSLAQYQSNLSLRFARVTVQAPWESCHEIGTGETDRREHTLPIYNARFMIRNASLDTGHQRLSNYYCCRKKRSWFGISNFVWNRIGVFKVSDLDNLTSDFNRYKLYIASKKWNVNSFLKE